MRVAPAIALTEEEQRTLSDWATNGSKRQKVRAQIILQAAKGHQNKEIAQALGTGEKVVGRWRRRFSEQGLAGIEKEAPRAGGRPRIDPEIVQEVIRKTEQRKSSRAIARAVGISATTVRRIWRRYDLDQSTSSSARS